MEKMLREAFESLVSMDTTPKQEEWILLAKEYHSPVTSIARRCEIVEMAKSSFKADEEMQFIFFYIGNVHVIVHDVFLMSNQLMFGCAHAGDTPRIFLSSVVLSDIDLFISVVLHELGHIRFGHFTSGTSTSALAKTRAFARLFGYVLKEEYEADFYASSLCNNSILINGYMQMIALSNSKELKKRLAVLRNKRVI